MRKVLKILLCTVLALILLPVGTILALWHNELYALASFEQLRDRNALQRDGAVYSITVPGGYYLEDFISQGGVSSDEELIAFVTKKLTKGIIPIDITSTDIGCSSFTAQAQDGDRLFGRNYDLDRTHVCIVRTKGTRKRHATLSTVDLKFIGIPSNRNLEGIVERIYCLAAPYIPLDGINDAGVSCGIYVSGQGTKWKRVPTDQQTDKPDITSTTLLRLILDYADDVDEAVEIAKGYDMHDSANSSYHYMVADATGRSAILEWVNVDSGHEQDGSTRELVVIYNDDDAALGKMEAASNFQCVTNFIVVPGYYTTENPALDEDARMRYDTMYQTLTETDGLVQDEQAAMDILRSVARRTINPYEMASRTVYSIVFNLTDKTMYWIPNEYYDDETAAFHFDLQ